VDEGRLLESVHDALKKAFRHEFLNRIDDTIIFHPLTQEQIIRVVDLMVEDVQGRLSERGITFVLTQAASRWLIEEGFEPVFGGRPLRRVIQRHLESQFSKGILTEDFRLGDHVIVDLGESGLALANSPEAKTA